MRTNPRFFKSYPSLKLLPLCTFIIFLTSIATGYTQKLNDTTLSFQEYWKFRGIAFQKSDYYLMNNRAFNATLLQSKTLFTFKNRVIGAGIGREVVFNSNAAFIPGQQAFRPIQGMPVYPQFIPVSTRPGISIFNRNTNAATLIQFGDLMEGRQVFNGGQIQLGKSWKIL